MSDLVKRLRTMAAGSMTGFPKDTCNEAADRIEALEGVLDRAIKMLREEHSCDIRCDMARECFVDALAKEAGIR